MIPQLPIDRIRAQFDARIGTSNLLIEAPTGSGKSTRLPIWCGERGRVLVVEPRRIACRALAAHVAGLMGVEVGGAVGYGIRFDSNYGPQTRILFATPGIALNLLAASGTAKSPFDGLNGIDTETHMGDAAPPNGLRIRERIFTVILDEFHERRWDTDLLAALLMHQNRHRLVVTSATVEGRRLAGYFNAERIESEGRLHPVEIGYLSDEEPPAIQGLEERAEGSIREALKTMAGGDILVFLPGKGEIDALHRRMDGRIDAEVIPLHAGTDPKLQNRALALADHRRVILATNVAETSLTIPGVRVVVDSGLERRTHHRNGRTVLGLHAVSRAAADQRAGRAGRLGPGRCIRLWGRRAPLEAHTPPEVLREELTDLLLAAAAAGIPATRLSFPDPLPDHAVQRAGERLRAMGALTEEGLLSAHGQRIAPLPLDPLFAHLITATPDAETQGAMIDLAAALSAGRSILRPIQGEEALRALKAWQPLPCDAATLIALIRTQPPPELPIDAATLQEARRIARHTRAVLELPPPPPETGFPRDRLLRAAAQAAPELLFVRRAKRRDALGNGRDELMPGRESRFADDAEAAVVFDQHSLPGRGTKQTLSFGTCMAPVPLNFIAELGLAELEYEVAEWKGGTLTVDVKRIYAGRTVRTDQIEPTGQPARAALARLILDNRLFKSAGQQLTDDIAAWNLYLHLGMGQGEPQEPLPWLEHRLAELGVESADDMQLIVAKDLAFEGIPAWQRAEFDERHPRRLYVENLPMAVSYDPKSKGITLERLGGIRKNPPKAWELPAWAGWKVWFQDGSRVVRVK